MEHFVSSRLKLDRANFHIENLKTLSSPLSTDLYSLEIEREFAFPKPEAISSTLVFKPSPIIAETFGLVMGDALTNLRGALDHMASRIARIKVPKAKPYFPLPEQWEDITNNRYMKELEEVLPGATKLLCDEIRPKGGEFEDYWSFADLDNDSKHNLILPTVVAGELKNYSLSAGGVNFNNCAFGGDASQKMMLMRCGGSSMTLPENLVVSVDLIFPLPGVFGGMNVISCLETISALIGNTIDRFEALFHEKYGK